MDKNANAEKQVPVEVLNKTLLAHLTRGTHADIEKVAAASSYYTRVQLRENAFIYNILPVNGTTDDMFTRSLTHNKLSIIEELEPESAGAKWVPFETVPEGQYIAGRFYEIPLARLITKEYTVDLDELRQYRSDIRKIITENSLKDAEKEIDRKFIVDTVDKIVEDTVGGINTAQKYTGKIQWASQAGGLTPENWAEAMKYMNMPSTFTGLEDKFILTNKIALMNHVTAKDMLKWKHEDIGQEVATNVDKGLVRSRLMGITLLFTIKSSIVPDNTVYFFPAPEFIGKAYEVYGWTTYMEKKMYFVKSVSYWLGGAAIGNVAAPVKVEFT